MDKKLNKDAVLSQVLKALEPMGEVSNLSIEETTVLYKAEVPFCLITDRGLYLRSDEYPEYHVFQGKRFGKSPVILEESDDILRAATRAYWIASGKW